MIRIEDLSVELAEFRLAGINLDIKSGEYFVILGPTGAGKTVLIEAIAGLHRISGGRIWLGKAEVTYLTPEKRGVSLVYQDQLLFPHLSVADNITFGLKLRRYSPLETKDTLDWLSGFLGIKHLLERKPETLSGGEKQKVSLARALSIKPKLLLLDEPLSALDPENREIIQQELRRIHDDLAITTLHVTHDFEEAIALGNRIAVIGDGTVQQTGTTEEIFRKPNSEFVARFTMVRNIFRGRVVGDKPEEGIFETDGVSLAVVTKERGICNASVRPEDIIVSHAPFPSSSGNALSGTITAITNKGSTLFISVCVPPDFVCLVTRNSFDAMDLAIGKQVYLTFKASVVNIF